MQSKLINTNKPYLVIILAMLYISFKLICNPIFFRQIELSIPPITYNLKVVGSALIYPFIYILSDVIVALSNRKTTIIIIVAGIICDGIFSFVVSRISNFALPSNLSGQALANTLAINQVGGQMWLLFIHGCIAALVVAIIEIIIFAALLKRLNNFFISTLISVVVTLVSHNLITDYPMLRQQSDAWGLIFHSLSINITIMFIYTTIVSLVLKIFKAKI